MSQSAPESYRVELPAHIRLADCYQCGKCTAGCPGFRPDGSGAEPDHAHGATGARGDALRSQAIWKCVACQTCSARCPKRGGLRRGDGRIARKLARSRRRQPRQSR